ncbi:hypothetical protein HanHA300_Chr12g0449041 [Helianthus annuus]|nr:hypothetical protein HanHA300_Chr12g0449041 [Helianthus annuus]
MKLSLANFELFLRFHFCAYIMLLLFIRLYIISMHKFHVLLFTLLQQRVETYHQDRSDFLTSTINSASFSSYNDLAKELGRFPGLGDRYRYFLLIGYIM